MHFQRVRNSHTIWLYCSLLKDCNLANRKFQFLYCTSQGTGHLHVITIGSLCLLQVIGYWEKDRKSLSQLVKASVIFASILDDGHVSAVSGKKSANFSVVPSGIRRLAFLHQL